MREHKYVIIQYESLARLKLAGFSSIDLLIIDEFESCIDQMQNNDKSYISIFYNLVQRSKTICAFDALLSNWSKELLTLVKNRDFDSNVPCQDITYHYASNYEHKAHMYMYTSGNMLSSDYVEYLKSDDFCQLIKENPKEAKKEIQKIESNKFAINDLTLLSDIKQRLDKGENVYCSIGYRTTIYKIEEMAEELNIKVMVYHGEDLRKTSDGRLMAQSKAEDFKDINKKINEIKPRLFISSLSLSAGVSIDIKYFHSFVCKYADCLSPVAQLQALNRVRHYINREGSIYLVRANFGNREYMDYFDILDLQIMSIKHTPEYYKILSAIELRDHLLKNNCLSYICNELLNMGFTLDTKNMNNAKSVPLIKELDKYVKNKKNITRLMIEEAFKNENKKTSDDQIIKIFNDNAPEVRLLKPEHEELLRQLKTNEYEFKMRNDLPDNIEKIVKEYSTIKKVNLSIKEYNSLTKFEYLGLLLFDAKRRKIINWYEITFQVKRNKFNQRALSHVTGREFALTSPQEAEDFHKLKYNEAIKHNMNITTANKCNIVISDKIRIKERRYAQVGAQWISLVRDKFSNLDAKIGLLKSEIYNMCDEIARIVPNIDKYFMHSLNCDSRSIKSKNAYFKALEYAGITFKTARERRPGGGQNIYRYIIIGKAPE